MSELSSFYSPNTSLLYTLKWPVRCETLKVPSLRTRVLTEEREEKKGGKFESEHLRLAADAVVRRREAPPFA